MCIVYAIIYRNQLNETHETIFLQFVKFSSKVCRIKLLGNFEYILYRAKLAAYEKERLRIETDNLENILLSIEDQRYYGHNGVDFRALIRSLLSLSNRYRIRKGCFRNGRADKENSR